MTNHPSRSHIALQAITPDMAIRHRGLTLGMPRTMEPIAYLASSHPMVPVGVLVRMRATGIYLKWVGGIAEAVDQRKARISIAKFEGTE